MSGRHEWEFSDCTEFRQILSARTPRPISAVFVLFVTMVGCMLLWLAVTKADLVVRGKGRVRPMIRSQRLANAVGEESQISSLRQGCVMAVHVQEGDEIRKGDLLVQLDTQQLDINIANQKRANQNCEDELAQLEQLANLMARRFNTARAKAEAELSEEQDEIQNSKAKQSLEIALAKVRLEESQTRCQRYDNLASSRVVTPEAVCEAKSRFREAKLQFEKSRVPIDEGRLRVLNQARLLLEADYSIACAELDIQRKLKTAELTAGRLQMAKLELERDRSQLTAPLDGIVISADVKVGEVVELGQPLMAVAEQRGFRMDVAVTNEDVGNLRIGMRARIKLDAYDYQKHGSLSGRVIFISPDSEFVADSSSPHPPIYTVKISLDSQQVSDGRLRHHVKLGMSGVAEIITGRESILSLLLRSTGRSISLG